MSSYQNSHRDDTALPVRLTVQVYQRLESVVELDLLPWHPADLVVDSLHHLEQKVNIFLVEVIGCSLPWGSWRPRPPLAPHPTSCSRSRRGHPCSSSRQTLAVAVPWLQPAARPGGDISDRMRENWKWKFSPDEILPKRIFVHLFTYPVFLAVDVCANSASSCHDSPEFQSKISCKALETCIVYIHSG